MFGKAAPAPPENVLIGTVSVYNRRWNTSVIFAYYYISRTLLLQYYVKDGLFYMELLHLKVIKILCLENLHKFSTVGYSVREAWRDKTSQL
jgi:hypothetical protein